MRAICRQIRPAVVGQQEVDHAIGFVRRGTLDIQLPGLVTSTFLFDIPGTDPPAADRPFDLPTKCIEIDGYPFRYVDIGQGEPVIFIHGSLGDYRTWGYQLEAFAEHHRVIAYSRRWHYPNPPAPPGTTSYSSGLHANDLAAFIAAIDCGPAHLAGNSMGALIALQTARRFPALVRSLLLNEPGQFSWAGLIPGAEEPLARLNSEFFAPATEAFRAGRTQEGIRRFVEGVMPGWWDKLSAPMIEVILDNEAAFRTELDATEWMSPFHFEDARAIRCPALVMTGADTLLLFRLINEQFARLLPGAEPVVVPEACHAIYCSKPDEFNRIVLDFIARQRSNPTG